MSVQACVEPQSYSHFSASVGVAKEPRWIFARISPVLSLWVIVVMQDIMPFSAGSVMAKRSLACWFHQADLNCTGEGGIIKQRFLSRVLCVRRGTRSNAGHELWKKLWAGDMGKNCQSLDLGLDRTVES